ncbi:EF-hand domain-containing protein [Agrilutibacter solisilvae]|uniref:EF-hand domain-containing protein n=1 Tax=Agrilutibacter solisilvae TaxID=2763317 RepID=A0A974Y4L7_9GAMM|nr:hypothetical protein [Lysobacter solisilvae]QSX77896.1 hypothetical protein I8J32_014385 [Lysobacter solisilvae]
MNALPLSSLLLVTSLIPASVCAQGVPTSATSSFQSLDTNADGVVDKSEYDSKALFRQLDSNGNSRISAEELEAVLGPQEDGQMSAVDRIRGTDRNQDGELSDEELRRGAETRFMWLDTNQDGKLELAEMKSRFGIPAPGQYQNY